MQADAPAPPSWASLLPHRLSELTPARYMCTKISAKQHAKAMEKGFKHARRTPRDGPAALVHPVTERTLPPRPGMCQCHSPRRTRSEANLWTLTFHAHMTERLVRFTRKPVVIDGRGTPAQTHQQRTAVALLLVLRAVPLHLPPKHRHSKEAGMSSFEIISSFRERSPQPDEENLCRFRFSWFILKSWSCQRSRACWRDPEQILDFRSVHCEGRSCKTDNACRGKAFNAKAA